MSATHWSIMKTSRIFKSVTLAILVGLLPGCQSPNGKPDYTGTGAVIGGGSGAAVGALADRNNRGVGALIGGAAGVIAGGLAGHVMDQRKEAAGKSTAVVISPGQPLSIGDIEAMAKAGVSDDIIIAKVDETHSEYYLDAKTIVDLKKAGVSDKLIAYMIGASAKAAETVSQTPPPPMPDPIPVSPGSNYIWMPGYWSWNGAAWVWVAGRWAVCPWQGAVWIGGHWVRSATGFVWIPGYWR